MDGTVHACFVLARLHYLAERLVKSSSTHCEAEQLASALRRHHTEFFVGDHVIQRYASFTPVGKTLYGAARQYMLHAQANC
jgi:hypothetical protein